MATKKKSAKAKGTARKKAVGKKAGKRAAPKAKKAAARKPARRVLKARQQPESLRLRAAGPSFTANDLQKSLAFYCDVLGFTPKERYEEEGRLLGVELLAGNVVFWLGQDDWKKGRDRVKGQGFRIYCTTTQDIDALARGIKGRGGRLSEEPRDEPWGGRAFSVVDPDGFAITFASAL